MKYLLQETYKRTKKLTGMDARTQPGFKAIISDPNSFQIYAKSLAEGLSKEVYEDFMFLAENTRVNLMENSMFQLNPYETLTLPVLRVFYPKLIAKELVNVMPIDKPDVIKGFIRAYFKKYDSTGGAMEATFGHAFPSVYSDISKGPGVGINVVRTVSEGTTDILAYASLDSSSSHVEKDFRITAILDSTANVETVSISPSVDGLFSESVTIEGSTDIISGHVDYLNGTFTWSSANGNVTNVRFEAYCSLEENQINPMVKFEVDKIRFTTVDRRISAEWTTNLEQDVKALFDITLQSELVNILGEQIAIDIDREQTNIHKSLR